MGYDEARVQELRALLHAKTEEARIQEAMRLTADEEAMRLASQGTVHADDDSADENDSAPAEHTTEQDI